MAGEQRAAALNNLATPVALALTASGGQAQRLPILRVGSVGALTMKKTAAALLLAACFSCNAVVAATTDDVKWINQCAKDNKGDASTEVVLKYCTCMNNKMDDKETRSITQWEKTHESERLACDKEAGWK
jgi:hypothetical protein